MNFGVLKWIICEIFHKYEKDFNVDVEFYLEFVGVEGVEFGAASFSLSGST